MKDKLTFYAIWLCTIMALAVVIGNGCTSTPPANDPLAGIEKFNAQVANDLSSPQAQALVQGLIPLVNFGLSINPATAAIEPINSAGAAALLALQQAYANKTGVTPQVAQTVISAAQLGLKATGNSSWIPYTPEAVTVLAGIVNTEPLVAYPVNVPATK